MGLVFQSVPLLPQALVTLLPQHFVEVPMCWGHNQQRNDNFCLQNIAVLIRVSQAPPRYTELLIQIRSGRGIIYCLKWPCLCPSFPTTHSTPKATARNYGWFPLIPKVVPIWNSTCWLGISTGDLCVLQALQTFLLYRENICLFMNSLTFLTPSLQTCLYPHNSSLSPIKLQKVALSPPLTKSQSLHVYFVSYFLSPSPEPSRMLFFHYCFN